MSEPHTIPEDVAMRGTGMLLGAWGLHGTAPAEWLVNAYALESIELRWVGDVNGMYNRYDVVCMNCRYVLAQSVIINPTATSESVSAAITKKAWHPRCMLYNPDNLPRKKP